MPDVPQNLSNRRNFLTGALRYSALGVLCTGAGLLGAKRYRLERQGVCINYGLCDRCKVLQTCGLPLALAARKLSKD